MQTCIRPSGCHYCYSLSLASVKSSLVLPFWYRPTRVVPDKGLLNGCVRVRVRMCACVCAQAFSDQLAIDFYFVLPKHTNFGTYLLIGITYLLMRIFVFSALRLLVGRQEEHPAGKN